MAKKANAMPEMESITIKPLNTKHCGPTQSLFRCSFLNNSIISALPHYGQPNTSSTFIDQSSFSTPKKQLGSFHLSSLPSTGSIVPPPPPLPGTRINHCNSLHAKENELTTNLCNSRSNYSPDLESRKNCTNLENNSINKSFGNTYTRKRDMQHFRSYRTGINRSMHISGSRENISHDAHESCAQDCSKQFCSLQYPLDEHLDTYSKCPGITPSAVHRASISSQHTRVPTDGYSSRAFAVGSGSESTGRTSGSQANLLSKRRHKSDTTERVLRAREEVNSSQHVNVAMLANNLNANLAQALAQLGLSSKNAEALNARTSFREKVEPNCNDTTVSQKNASNGMSGFTSIGAGGGCSLSFRRKPKHHFLSQLYFLIHLAFTVCLLKLPDLDTDNKQFYSEIFAYYIAYLLSTAVLFILALRCCKNENLFEQRDKRSENTSILFGCIALGIVQLISIGLDLTQCLESEFLFLPILQFIFVFLLMHFILLQTKQSSKYFYNNIAVAHLLAAQMSIWLGHYQRTHMNACGYIRSIALRNQTSGSGYAFMKRMLSPNLSNGAILLNSTLPTPLPFTAQFSNASALSMGTSSNMSTLASATAAHLAREVGGRFSDLLLPLMQHYQLLVLFILLSIWLNNNQIRPTYLRPRLHESDASTGLHGFSDNEFTSSAFLSPGGTRLHSLKGFFLGMLIIAITIIVLVLGDDYITLITHSGIQAICTTVAIIALFLRGRKRKGLHKLPVKYFDPNEFHLFVLGSLACAYFCAFCALLLNGLQPEVVFENLLDSCLLLLQITCQTLLLRTDGRKIHKLREFYGFLIIANFSLWVLEITEIASLNFVKSNIFNINILPQIMVSLNRFYAALVFIHFWTSK